MTVCNEAGSNSQHMYLDNDDNGAAPDGSSAPWVGGGPTASPPDQHAGAPEPEDALRGADGDRRGRQPCGRPSQTATCRTSRQPRPPVPSKRARRSSPTARTSARRAGTPAAPGALNLLADKLDVQSGQGLRLQMVNASAIRYMRLRLTTQAGSLVAAGPRRRRGRPARQRRSSKAASLGAHRHPLRGGRDPAAAGQPRRRRRGHPAGLPVDSVLTLWTQDFQRTGLGYSRTSRPFRSCTSTSPARRADLHIPPGHAAAGRHRRPGRGAPARRPATSSNPATFTPAKIGKPVPNLRHQARQAGDADAAASTGRRRRTTSPATTRTSRTSARRATPSRATSSS